MSKLTKTILSVSTAVVTIAGIAVLAVCFWEQITALLPCKKKQELEDDFVTEV